MSSMNLTMTFIYIYKSNIIERYSLKCICNEIFDIRIFALSKNFIFSDHFDTNLVKKFQLEVGKFLD